MRLVTLYLPERYVKELNELVRRGLYRNRSSAIRSAVKYLLDDEYRLVKQKIDETNKTKELCKALPGFIDLY